MPNLARIILAVAVSLLVGVMAVYGGLNMLDSGRPVRATVLLLIGGFFLLAAVGLVGERLPSRRVPGPRGRRH